MTGWITLWDGRHWPGRLDGGLPTFPFRLAPEGLATRRQLRDRGLCPGGHEPWARLEWSRGRRHAWLYVIAWAKPSRRSTPAQLVSLDKAMRARRTCARGHVADHCVRLSDRLCGDHAFAADQAASRTYSTGRDAIAA